MLGKKVQTIIGYCNYKGSRQKKRYYCLIAFTPSSSQCCHYMVFFFLVAASCIPPPPDPYAVCLYAGGERTRRPKRLKLDALYMHANLVWGNYKVALYELALSIDR